MELTLVRYYKKANYTIGKLYLNGRYFCDTLEDTDRGLADWQDESAIKSAKVYGKTAIPTGRYEFTLSQSPRFGRLLPILYNVKGFSAIRIHSGNTDNDTEGCILVGKNRAVGKVLDSRATEQELMRFLQYNNKGDNFITIVG